MQAVPQPYSTQAYTRVQNSSASPEQRISVGKNKDPFSPSASQQSADDSISLSAEGKQLSQEQTEPPDSSRRAEPGTSSPDNAENTSQESLSTEELQHVSELQQRDAEVRSHEQAHLSAAGQYAAGGASFSYTTGPNGKRYATGGKVPIDISKEKTPEATILKMRTVRRAALAPANPSGADRNIAAQASSKEAQAMKDVLEQAEISPSEPPSSNDTTAPRSENKQTSTSPQEKPPRDPGDSVQVSDFSRRSMTSAYQAIATLAN